MEGKEGSLRIYISEPHNEPVMYPGDKICLNERVSHPTLFLPTLSNIRASKRIAQSESIKMEDLLDK